MKDRVQRKRRRNLSRIKEAEEEEIKTGLKTGSCLGQFWPAKELGKTWLGGTQDELVSIWTEVGRFLRLITQQLLTANIGESAPILHAESLPAINDAVLWQFYDHCVPMPP